MYYEIDAMTLLDGEPKKRGERRETRDERRDRHMKRTSFALQRGNARDQNRIKP